MSGAVWIPIGTPPGDPLIILDADRRLYVGISRDGSYFHVIQPLIVEQLDGDGNVVRPAGALGCRCKGGIFFGTCYRTMEAEAWERADHASLKRPDWALPDPRELLAEGSATFDAPAGAGESVEAARG